MDLIMAQQEQFTCCASTGVLSMELKIQHTATQDWKKNDIQIFTTLENLNWDTTELTRNSLRLSCVTM